MYIFNYKYYKWFALIPGWTLGGFIGAIASFLLVRELMLNKENEVGLELALLKIASLLIKSDGSIDRSEVNLVQTFFRKTYGVSKANKLFKDLKSRSDMPSDISSLTGIIKKKLNPSKHYSIIQFLFSLSAIDGVISNSEIEFIYNYLDLANNSLNE